MSKMTEHELKVCPVNAEKIKTLITYLLPLTAEVRGYRIDLGALYDNCIVDNECCYVILEPRYHDSKIQLVYDIPVRYEKKAEGGYSIRMDAPDFYFPLGVDQLKEYLDAPVSLIEFMGSRYNYNSRIKMNMREFLVAANESHVEANG